jgi:biotin carboxylase
MQRQQTILVISAGFRPQLLSTPKEMGFRVAVVDHQPPADHALYDDFIPAPPTDAQAVLLAVRKYVSDGHDLDAVASFFDGSLHVAAAICEEFGLPGNSREAVRNMRDKYRNSLVLAAAGLPVPITKIVQTEAEVLKAAGQVGFPVILKPQASAGSQGVIKASNADELVHAFTTIRGIFEQATFGEGESAIPNIGHHLFYPTARAVLLQEYISGPEICVDVVYNQDACKVLGIMDKPQLWPEPYFPELILVTPSSLPAGIQSRVHELCVQILAAVGATAGAAHIEFRIAPDGSPKVIEVNGRIGGPSVFVQEAIQISTGLWGPREYIAAISGDPLDRNDPRPVGKAAGFASLPLERFGRIVRFEGQEEVLRLPGVLDIRWAMRPGQFVPEGYPRNPSVMFAHVLASGDSNSDVVRTLERARAGLKAVVAE